MELNLEVSSVDIGGLYAADEIDELLVSIYIATGSMFNVTYALIYVLLENIPISATHLSV